MTKSEFDIIIICGVARSGKDTFIDYIREITGKKNVAHVSSIDSVSTLLKAYGIDTSEKTEADRTLLAEVKEALEKHSDAPTRRIITRAMVSKNAMLHRFFITQFRKKTDIERIRRLHEGKDRIIVVRVRRDAAEEKAPKNAADQDWINIEPDFEINNNGTHEELRTQAENLVAELNKEY